MEDNSMWGAALVAWLLIVPIIGAVISARWGGDSTSATYAHHGHGRMAHDNASVPPERVDYSATSGERDLQQSAIRDRELRDRDGRGMPRH